MVETHGNQKEGKSVEHRRYVSLAYWAREKRDHSIALAGFSLDPEPASPQALHALTAPETPAALDPASAARLQLPEVA